jgi:uncharacterized repeat protein (TIGR01451 family)
MKKIPMLATASLTTLLAVAITAPAYAWHPAGTIIKTIQNQTAGGAVSDANDAGTAVSAAPGDTLVYTITVKNTAEVVNNNNNDMVTTMSDNLPSGVELVSNPATRTITEDLGTIAPGQSKTKTYSVKVTDTTDGDVITNQACFEGVSIIGDTKVPSTCDQAVVKVKVPAQPTTPTVPTTPSAPSAPEAPVEALPNTGSTGLTAALVITTAVGIGYAVNTLRLRRSQ